MAEINARALMFNLGREDAIDSTTSAKIARYAERKQLAYKLTDEGVLLLDGRGKKIHLRNGVVTLRNALGLHALPERIGDNRVLNKQQQHTNVVTMLHVRKMALVDPRLLKSLRENPTPLPDAIDTALRDLDAEMTSILDGSDADESEKVRLYNQALLRYNDMTKARAAKPIPVVVEVKKEAAATTASVVEPADIVGSRVVEMMGRLHVDLFMQDRFLINGVTVKIRLVRSKDAFSLMAGGVNPDYKVRIVDAVLFVRKAVLSPTVAMAHIRALEKGTAKYPLRPVDCKVYSIAQGSMSSTHENLFLGTLPKRIILWCVDNDALNGAFGKNPFHAKNNAINFLAVYVDGRQVPAKPLQPNFETGQYVRSYVNLFSATGKQGQDEGNELTRDDFGNGYTFFGFDLTPDACDGGCFHLVQKGNLRIEIHFAAPLAQTVNVVVYGESEAVLEIDKGRNIIYDH